MVAATRQFVDKIAEDIVDYLVFFSFNPFKGIAGFDDDESYLETLRFIDYVLKHDIMLVA